MLECTLEGVYVSYEAATKKLWFNDGSFWLMNAESNGSEDDAGTLYPSLMQDSNGNQIKIRYKTGINWFAANSSARIDEIEDVKASATSGGYITYKFLWSNEALPHLTSISPTLGGPGAHRVGT